MARALQQKGRLLTFMGNSVFDQLIPTDVLGEEGLSRLFSFTIFGYCKDIHLILDTLLHQCICLQLTDNGQTRLFHGYVNSIESLGVTGHNLRRFSLHLTPQLWFLETNRQSRIFQDKTIPDIAQSILKENGISPFDNKGLTGSYPTIPYCVQYNETDLHFISRLLEEAGIFYYFTFDTHSHTLHLVDNLGVLPLYASPLVYSNIRQDGEYIHTWTVTHKITSIRAASSDYNYLTPKTSLACELTSTDSMNYSGLNVGNSFFYPGGYQSVSDGQKAVRRRLQQYDNQSEMADGKSNVMALSGGFRFQLNSGSASGVSGQYILTRIKHEAHDSSPVNVTMDALIADAAEHPAQSYENQFECCSSLRSFTPDRKHKKPIVHGFHNAIVTGSGENQVDTDHLGRIRVKFLWNSSDNNSCWIRVLQQQAGSDPGTHFLPRVGQEVLIQYIDGDIDKPICVGAHYNPLNQTPYPLPENQHLSGIKTQSMGADAKGFHEVQFNALQEQEKILLQAQNRMQETIEHDAVINIGNDESSQIGGHQTINVGQNAMLHSPTQTRFSTAGSSITIKTNSIRIQAAHITVGK